MAVCRASNATERPAIPEHHGAPACLIPRAQGCQYIKVSSVQLCIPQIKTYIKPLACFGVTYLPFTKAHPAIEEDDPAKIHPTIPKYCHGQQGNP